MTMWEEAKEMFNKTDAIVTLDVGTIDFSPKEMKAVVHGQFKSYDEYLEIQRKSCATNRRYFEECYYNFGGENSFKGEVIKINSANKTVLFKRIFISGIYDDGNGFTGKEDHVWVTVSNTSLFLPGKSYSFEADVYRYMRHGKGGKSIDFGLRNLRHIKESTEYTLPSNEELIDQTIENLVCGICMFKKHCYGTFCLMNEDDYKKNSIFLNP